MSTPGRRHRKKVSTASDEADGGVVIPISTDRLIRRVVIFWVAAEVALVLLDVVVNYGNLTSQRPIRRLCNMAREDGLATWFSSCQLLLVGGTLWLIRLRVRAGPRPGWRPLGWGILAVFFLYMAIDDSAKVHERFGSVFKAAFSSAGDGAGSSPGGRLLELFPSYPWQIVFGPVFGAFGLFMVVFLWRQLGQRSARILVALGLACYVIAVGLDFVEGMEDAEGVNYAHERLAGALAVDPPTFRHFAKVMEEFIELFGTTLFLAGFMTHFAQRAQASQIRFDKTERAPRQKRGAR